MRCLEARNSRILPAPPGTLAISSTSSTITTTGRVVRGRLEHAVPGLGELAARSVTRCRAHSQHGEDLVPHLGRRWRPGRRRSQRQRLPGELIAHVRAVESDQGRVRIAVTRSRTSLSRVDFPLPVAPCTPMALAPIASNRVTFIGSPVSGMIPTGTGSRMLASAGNQSGYGESGTATGW